MLLERGGSGTNPYSSLISPSTCFHDYRELLLDLPALALHVESLFMSWASDPAPAQMPLGGALQQLAIVVTLPVAPEATHSQFPNATQSYGWLREMKRAHSKLAGTPHHLRCSRF